jgi:hypothetical protein
VPDDCPAAFARGSTSAAALPIMRVVIVVALILAGWLLCSLLAVCLCWMAKRGDEAQLDPTVTVRRLERPLPARRTASLHGARHARRPAARR